MKKQFTIIAIILGMVNVLFAQSILENKIDTEPNFKNNVIKVEYQKKSPAKAALLSSLFPGAGQIYNDSSSIGGYIFPVIEVALWFGYFHFRDKATGQEDDYKKYVNSHYSRKRQHAVEDIIINIIPEDKPDNWQGEGDYYDDVYTKDLFRLDKTNTQHFYEDVAKYNKYVFGWDDWFNKYVNLDEKVNEWDAEKATWLPSENDGSYAIEEIYWQWNPSELDPTHAWVGNTVANTNHPDYNPNEPTSDPIYSANRAKYIKMRKDAEDTFDKAHYISWGIMANHLISAIHAAYVTKKQNLSYITQNKYQINLASVKINKTLTPILNLSFRF